MTNPMTPTEQDKELREKLLSLYSANFNDGEPIESRVGSRDMFDVSAIVDFIDDFVVPLITADRKRVALEARIDGLHEGIALAEAHTLPVVKAYRDAKHTTELKAAMKSLKSGFEQLHNLADEGVSLNATPVDNFKAQQEEA